MNTPGKTTKHSNYWVAIQTKFLPSTPTHGARVKAWTEGTSVTLPYNCRDSIYTSHAAAAQAVIDKLNLPGTWQGVELPGPGYVFVRIS